MVRRFRSLPIRSRLALLVAAAVAFAVAAVSVTCWFIVKEKLYDEVNGDLRAATRMAVDANDATTLINNCTQTPSTQTGINGFGPRARTMYYEIVKADGTACISDNSAGLVKVTDSDKQVAKKSTPGTWTLRTGTDSKGNAVQVLTLPLMVSNGDPRNRALAEGYALVVATPLKATQSTLNDLALVLLLVSGIGVVGAGAAGLWVARAGLRPVDKLTDAVEHVARTEDLTIRIPVEEHSEDEIARLSRSFNSMTASLASSRELQQQLIADAGHELRTP